MDVRLLGPVAVVDGQRVVPVRQRRQRALLALLALRAGETLAADRLVEDLWGSEAPRTAVASLHNAVSQLRKLLGPDAVLTREPGYALDTDHVDVDVVRFEHLFGEARAARSMQAEETAATILREALALWHGPALADLSYEPFAQAEIRRLEELRQAALEERIDVDLALGRHLELVPELESLVVQEPLRERLQTQLMLALYRGGRQADALAAYRDARATLVEELGIEPGPELRNLHSAILRQDDSLLLAGARTTAPRTSMQFRRLATILVAEILASSGAGELDPEALHHVLGEFYEAVASIVSGHGAAAERMAGDAVMAAFGVSTADETHALRAARAAVDIRAAVERLQDVGEGGAQHHVSIGIATGEVLASGTSGRQQLVTGEAIAVAAGLQQAAGAGEVVIGPLTRRLLGTAATLETLGGLELKGRARPVPAFRLVGVSSDTPPSANLLDAPLVGRKREVRALRAALREAGAKPAVRAVCVLGPAGIGKSRLAREVVRGARGFDVLAGRCPSYGRGLTYWPLRQIVGDDRDAIRAPLGDERDADTVAERLATLDGPAPEIAWAFTRWCDARARRRPLLLVLDDVHWAEPTFLDLVEHLVGRGGGRIALLALAREELLEQRTAFLEGHPNATRITLDGLAVAETEALVEQLLGGAPLPIDVRARVFETAEGNPLFIEQFIAFAAEGDLLGTDKSLPATIQALLAARLDRLGPGERAVLERAAVIGREFTSDHVAGLLDPVAVPTAARHLAALTRRGFVQVRGNGALRFRHVLLQDAAYRAAPKRLRAGLHERLADRLDGEAADDELVGYHLERAYRLRTELAPPDRAALRLAEDAGRRLGDAGIRAWKRFDAPAAGSLLRRATTLLPTFDTRRLELLCELGTVLKFVSDDAGAEAALAEASDVAAASGIARLHGRAELERAWPRYLRGEIRGDEIVALAEDAIPAFEGASDDRGLGRAWLLIAAVRSLHGEWGACKDAAARALAHHHGSGYPPAACLSMLASAVYAGPEPVDAAIGYCEQLVEDEAGDATARSHILLLLAHLDAMRGRVDAARAALVRTRAFHEERGGEPTSDWVGASASVEMLGGRASRAEEILREACTKLEARGDRAWLATLEAALADALCQQDRFHEAVEHAGRARRFALPDDFTAQIAWRRSLARARAGTGAAVEGERLAREAIAMLEPTDALNDKSAAVIDLAEVLYLAGRTAEAGAAAAEGIGLLARKGNVRGSELARARFAMLATTQDGEGSRVGLPSHSA